MSKMKRCLALALCMGMALTMAACGGGGSNGGQSAAGSSAGSTGSSVSGSSSASGDVTKVLFGIRADLMPNAYLDESGQFAGQNYEVMCLVDELLPQYEFEYEAADQDAILMGLDAGKYVGGVGNFWYNDTRAEKYIFPKEQISGGIEGFAVNKQYESEVATLDDFTIKGLKQTPLEANGAMYSVFEQYNKDNPDHPINLDVGEPMPSGELMRWVIDGRFDGAAMFSNEYDELKPQVDPDDQLYFVPFYAVKTWVLYNKNYQELVDAIDGAMTQLREAGTLAELSVEYYGYNIYDYFED